MANFVDEIIKIFSSYSWLFIFFTLIVFFFIVKSEKKNFKKTSNVEQEVIKLIDKERIFNLVFHFSNSLLISLFVILLLNEDTKVSNTIMILCVVIAILIMVFAFINKLFYDYKHAISELSITFSISLLSASVATASTKQFDKYYHLSIWIAALGFVLMTIAYLLFKKPNES